jgi:UDP-glucose 4-epimerase
MKSDPLKKAPKTLVIGGCGFIGSHVVDVLLAEGTPLRVLDRRPEPFRPPLAGVEYVFGDFSDSRVIYEALEGVEAVFHGASTTVPATSNLDPIADITGNLIATVRLLEILRNLNIRKLVYLSSGGTVYGVPQDSLVREDHPKNPINSYGIVKAAVENYIFMEQQLNGLEPVVLRPSNPYGPRQGHTGTQGIIGTYLWKLQRGESLEVWGDGAVVRDFIFVRDLATLCANALKSTQTGCFNAGSGQGHSVQDILKTVIQVTGLEADILYKKGRNYDVPKIVLDVHRAETAFSWRATTELEAGIRASWDWVRAHGRSVASSVASSPDPQAYLR